MSLTISSINNFLSFFFCCVGPNNNECLLLGLMKQKKRGDGEEKKKFKTKKIQKKIIKFSRLFFMAFFQSADED